MRKQDLLTWEEVRRMASLTRNARDRAFIMVLYDSGLRISEILPLRIEDVELDESGGVLHTDGKTGKAPGIIGWSAPTLATWLDHHPFKNNRKAPLWCKLGVDVPSMVTYEASIQMPKKYAAKAGITKQVWHHLFKHTAATRDSKKLPAALMNMKFHWKQHSRMPSFYVHLSGEDVDDVRKLLYGAAPGKQNQENGVELRDCPRCSLKISPETSICNRCGLAVDAKGATQLRDARAKIDELLNKLTEDPKKLEKLLALLES